MSIQTATNRFIVPPKIKSAGFYQHLFREVSNNEQLGSRLIRLSEQARAIRQFDHLSEYALVLSNLPSPTYRTIGQFYLGLSLCQNGSGELDKAQAILETVANVGPTHHRAEAMISLSSIACVYQKLDDTLQYCTEAIKLVGPSLIGAKAARGIAIVKSWEGFHTLSLRDLENLYPIIKHAPPHIYFDYLNSYAVELAACGRFGEATNVSAIACSSPLVSVYPEWRETAEDIRLRRYSSRSVVSFAQRNTPQNLVRLPEPEPTLSLQPEPARVLNYTDWKNKMVKEQKDEKDVDAMDTNEILVEILHTTSEHSASDKTLREILKSIRKIIAKKA